MPPSFYDHSNVCFPVQLPRELPLRAAWNCSRPPNTILSTFQYDLLTLYSEALDRAQVHHLPALAQAFLEERHAQPVHQLLQRPKLSRKSLDTVERFCIGLKTKLRCVHPAQVSGQSSDSSVGSQVPVRQEVRRIAHRLHPFRQSLL